MTKDDKRRFESLPDILQVYLNNHDTYKTYVLKNGDWDFYLHRYIGSGSVPDHESQNIIHFALLKSSNMSDPMWNDICRGFDTFLKEWDSI